MSIIFRQIMKKLLQTIGLSEREAEVYLIGLSSIKPTAQFLAKKTGIKRSSIYDIVGSLSQKWLISKCMEWKSSYFRVASPEELLAYLDRNRREVENDIDQKKHVLKQHLVELQSLQNIRTTKPQVRFFEWDLGMREAYEDTLRCKEKKIAAFANVETMHGALPNFFPEYYMRRKNAGVSIRAVLPDNALSLERRKHDNRELRSTKVVDDSKYHFTPEINLYDDKVLIVSWLEKMAIMIESAEIADCFKKMYDLLWEHIPEMYTDKK